MCDIGSSTGGFCDCAIQNGIKEIFAIDVGSNQFDANLRKNSKIHLYENTDFRNLDINLLKNVDLVTIDVSFISVTKLISKKNEQDTNTYFLNDDEIRQIINCAFKN